MKEYIITIVGATLISAIGNVLTPDNMRKYVSVITGFIIISVIISPLASLGNIDLFARLKAPANASENYESVYTEAVADELKERIEGDIKTRIKEEFSKEVVVKAELLTEDGDIKEISQISVRGAGANKKIATRLMEVYNVKEVIMDGQKFSRKNP